MISTACKFNRFLIGQNSRTRSSFQKLSIIKTRSKDASQTQERFYLRFVSFNVPNFNLLPKKTNKKIGRRQISTMNTTKLNHRRFANTKAQGDATKTQEDETKIQEHGTKTQGDETKTQEGTTPKEETTTKKDNWIKPTNDDDNHSPASVKLNVCLHQAWCMPPPDLTCASTKLDICHRLTQRVPPPSLMTVTAWPESKFRKHKSHSPTPIQLRSPQRGVMVQPKLFSDSTLYIYTREQKNM